MYLLDTTLLAPFFEYTWLIVFAVAALLFRYEASQGKQYVGSFLAIGIAVVACLFIPSFSQKFGLMAATLITVVIGRMDEIQPISARWQLIWQVCIATILVGSGWTIPFITHPLAEGVLSLHWITLFGISFPADVLAIAWIVLLMNVVNWIDGMDGLAAGVGTIGFITLACVAMLPAIQHAQTLGMAGVGAAALAAFFIWNMPPARVYLGTIGSWFVGMYIAITAAGGGGKIATTLILFSLPLVDAGIVIARRYLAGRPLWQGDTVSHLHHRLKAKGVHGRTILAAALVLTAWFALISVLLGTQTKLMVLGVGAGAALVAVLALWGQRAMIKRSYEHASAIHHR